MVTTGSNGTLLADESQGQSAWRKWQRIKTAMIRSAISALKTKLTQVRAN